MKGYSKKLSLLEVKDNLKSVVIAEISYVTIHLFLPLIYSFSL